MATATSIIRDALMELGVLAEGDTATASMSNDALRALNRVCELLSNGKSFAYYPSLSQRALTGESSFTIGPSGDVTAARPISIESAYNDRSGISYPVRVVDNQLWDSIAYKGLTGQSNAIYIWYEPLLPNGVVHVWPITSGCTLNMRTVNMVASFPDLTTNVSLPPAYEDCLICNLAVRLSTQYPAGVLSVATVANARNTLKTIRKTNLVVPTLSLPSSVTSNGGNVGYANFISGMI